MESLETENYQKNVNVQSSQRSSRSFFVAQMALRTLALAASAVSACVIVTSGMTVLVYGIKFEARYSYSSATRYLFGVDCALCVFSALSLLSLCFLRRTPPTVKSHFFIFLHDLVVMVLAMSGSAAATAIGFVAKFGDQKMGWIAVCDQVPKFCTRILMGIAFSYVVFLCYFILSLLSINKLISISSTSSLNRRHALSSSS